MLPKIEKKEQELLASGVIPRVVVCGAGAAGTELAFAFKVRWQKVFNCEIEVTLVCAHTTVLKGADSSVIEQTTRKMTEHRINVVYNSKIS